MEAGQIVSQHAQVNKEIVLKLTWQYCIFLAFLVVVDCGNLLAPSNGGVMLSGTTFTSTATYSCNDGYTLEGVTARTCLASGSWSDTAPTCTGEY